MASNEHRSGRAGVEGLRTRADILWAVGCLGIATWGLTFFWGPWVLFRSVGAGFAMAAIATVVAGGVALAVAYFATRGIGGLRMLLAPPTPPAVI